MFKIYYVALDLDMTTVDCSHRLNWIKSTPKNWAAFHAATYEDEPIQDMVDLVRALHSTGQYKFVAITARGEDNRELTEKYLQDKSGLQGCYEKLYMRPSGDMRSDSIVKPELVMKAREDGYPISMALEDRHNVTNAYREMGLRVLHVQGDDY